jgi:hypothetical protein
MAQKLLYSMVARHGGAAGSNARYRSFCDQLPVADILTAKRMDRPVVLSEHTAATGNFQTVARRILEKANRPSLSCAWAALVRSSLAIAHEKGVV